MSDSKKKRFRGGSRELEEDDLEEFLRNDPEIMEQIERDMQQKQEINTMFNTLKTENLFLKQRVEILEKENEELKRKLGTTHPTAATATTTSQFLQVPVKYVVDAANVCWEFVTAKYLASTVDLQLKKAIVEKMKMKGHPPVEGLLTCLKTLHRFGGGVRVIIRQSWLTYASVYGDDNLLEELVKTGVVIVCLKDFDDDVFVFTVAEGCEEAAGGGQKVSVISNDQYRDHSANSQLLLSQNWLRERQMFFFFDASGTFFRLSKDQSNFPTTNTTNNPLMNGITASDPYPCYSPKQQEAIVQLVEEIKAEIERNESNVNNNDGNNNKTRYATTIPNIAKPDRTPSK